MLRSRREIDIEEAKIEDLHLRQSMVAQCKTFGGRYEVSFLRKSSFIHSVIQVAHVIASQVVLNRSLTC